MFFLKSRGKTKGLVGLSIELNKISVAHIISKNGKPPQLELLESVRFENEAEQAKVLTELVHKNKLSNARCNLVVDPGLYKLLQVEAPDVADDEVRLALKWQITDLIDFPVDEAIVDVFKVPEQGNPGAGRPKLINAAVMHMPKNQALVELVKASGLRLLSIDIAELALRNLALHVPEDGNGVALLHVAERWSLVNLTQQKLLYITRGLGSNLSQLGPIEEALNGEFGIGFEDSTRLDNLVLEIQRSLGYYESHYGQAPIGNLVISPTYPELPSLIHHLSTHLGIPVQALDLNVLLTTKTPLDLTQQADGLLAVAAALREEKRK